MAVQSATEVITRQEWLTAVEETRHSTIGKGFRSGGASVEGASAMVVFCARWIDRNASEADLLHSVLDGLERAGCLHHEQVAG